MAPDIYEELYEAHAAENSDQDVVGSESFELIGRMELESLVRHGLTPTGTIVDLGCGIGRMASFAVPWLVGGAYIGTDVSASLLARAKARLDLAVPNPPCPVSWVKQVGTTFDVPDASVDAFCAFSVFTHIEHEDSYNFLLDARRAVRPGGRFVFSCLPLSLPYARNVFREQAGRDFAGRWSSVRNVATSVDMMERLAVMAGWDVLHWYPGDEEHFQVDGRTWAFGQSVCVLGPAAP